METLTIAKYLALAGLALLAMAAILWAASLLGLGRLPGDLLFRRGNTTVHVPIVTMIIVSIILTVVLNLIFRK